MPTYMQMSGRFPGDAGAATHQEVERLLSNPRQFLTWARLVIDGAKATGPGASTVNLETASPIETYLQDFGVDDPKVMVDRVWWVHGTRSQLLPNWARELHRAWPTMGIPRVVERNFTGDAAADYLKGRGLV